MLETILTVAGAAAFHHHVTYPLSLIAMPARGAQPLPALAEAPEITLIVPAYREEQRIAAKIANIAALDYPAGKLKVRIVCDGSPDATPAKAREALGMLTDKGIDAVVVDHAVNRGKVAVLNEAIAAATSPVVALSDASAAISADALRRVAAAFADPKVGVVGGLYDCDANGSAGEKRYWAAQNRLRLGEAALGSPLGFSGAFYAVRREAVRPLEADTINDDFILPMRVVAAGWKAVLDPEMKIVETERTRPGQEWARRVRIGAGNVQQVVRLASLANPLRPGLAYAFVSGKGLRAFMPFILVAFVLSLALLAGRSWMHFALFAAMAAGMLYTIGALSVPERRRSRLQAMAAAVVSGYAASGIGGLQWMTGRFDARRRWSLGSGEAHPVPLVVRISKRAFDILGGSALMLILAIVFIPVAIAIKLDSRGPLFYRQLRVGRALADRTDLFEVIKFRTMRTDAEKNGAAWASKKDPRITRVGDFLRKTRLDELPQAINVLRGEMSMVGPRPERPVFFGKLEDNIPLYVERTYGILPGITGLAQVRQGYDETIEDVRAKVGWDHAYAMHLDSFWSWLKADVGIALETVGVMVGRKGR